MKTYILIIVLLSLLHCTTSEEPCRGFCEIFSAWTKTKPSLGFTTSSSINFQYSKSSSVAVQVPITMTTPIEIKIESSTSEITTLNPETTSDFVIISEQNNDTKGSDCLAKCPVTAEDNPVCGTNNVTYSNIWRLRCAKICGVDVELLDRSPCQSSNGNDESTTSTPEITIGKLKYIRCIKTCPTGAEYMLLCGTDMETYVNIERLKCARSCGKAVELLCVGPCPVCAPLATNGTITN